MHMYSIWDPSCTAVKYPRHVGTALALPSPWPPTPLAVPPGPPPGVVALAARGPRSPHRSATRGAEIPGCRCLGMAWLKNHM